MGLKDFDYNNSEKIEALKELINFMKDDLYGLVEDYRVSSLYQPSFEDFVLLKIKDESFYKKLMKA